VTTTSRRSLAAVALTGLIAATLTSAAATPATATPAGAAPATATPATATPAVVTPAVTTPAVASPGTAAAAVGGVVLPAGQAIAEAIDISPSGVVVGTQATAQGAPTAGQVWTPRADRAWARRPLAVPDGVSPSRVSGVTDGGEAGGYIGTGTAATAHRWSADGQVASPLAPAQSATSAVGPDQWLVNLGDSLSASQTAVVARDGTTTRITGIPGRAVAGKSVAGPQTALLSSIDGAGQQTVGTLYVWESGVSQALPIFQSFTHGTGCVSDIQPDGSVAYSGAVRQPDGSVTSRLGVLRGGVGGQDTALEIPAGAYSAHLDAWCTWQDLLSSDGWTIGAASWYTPRGTEPVVWRPDGTAVLPGLRDDESNARAMAVATGGRVVIEATTAQGERLFHWRGGVRTPLTVPSGWSVSNVVELTDTGYVLANLDRIVGNVAQSRPAVWRVPTR
jgi:hypothetical protein